MLLMALGSKMAGFSFMQAISRLHPLECKPHLFIHSFSQTHFWTSPKTGSALLTTERFLGRFKLIQRPGSIKKFK
jgi:hypothetical protein